MSIEGQGHFFTIYLPGFKWNQITENLSVKPELLLHPHEIWRNMNQKMITQQCQLPYLIDLFYKQKIYKIPLVYMYWYKGPKTGGS